MGVNCVTLYNFMKCRHELHGIKKGKKKKDIQSILSKSVPFRLMISENQLCLRIVNMKIHFRSYM